MRIAVIMAFLGLHARHGLLGLDGILEHIEQVDDLPVLVRRACQCIIDPAVRLAADIKEQVAVGNLYNIICGRLIAVQVNAVVEQHSNIGIVCLVTENLTDPVVFRENGGNDLQFAAVLFGERRTAAAGQHTE